MIFKKSVDSSIEKTLSGNNSIYYWITYVAFMSSAKQDALVGENMYSPIFGRALHTSGSLYWSTKEVKKKDKK